jgi:hypothetical protein
VSCVVGLRQLPLLLHLLLPWALLPPPDMAAAACGACGSAGDSRSNSVITMLNNTHKMCRDCQRQHAAFPAVCGGTATPCPAHDMAYIHEQVHLIIELLTPNLLQLQCMDAAIQVMHRRVQRCMQERTPCCAPTP